MEGQESFREESGRVLLPFASCKTVISSEKFLYVGLQMTLCGALQHFGRVRSFNFLLFNILLLGRLCGAGLITAVYYYSSIASSFFCKGAVNSDSNNANYIRKENKQCWRWRGLLFHTSKTPLQRGEISY